MLKEKEHVVAHRKADTIVQSEDSYKNKTKSTVM